MPARILIVEAKSNFTDSEQTPRSLREAEAEAVAMLLCESLQLPGAEYSRGYIQSWLRGDVIPEKSAMKIFGAADRILKAGQDEKFQQQGRGCGNAQHQFASRAGPTACYAALVNALSGYWIGINFQLEESIPEAHQRQYLVISIAFRLLYSI
jgi:hypothetical protein